MHKLLLFGQSVLPAGIIHFFDAFLIIYILELDEELSFANPLSCCIC